MDSFDTDIEDEESGRFRWLWRYSIQQRCRTVYRWLWFRRYRHHHLAEETEIDEEFDNEMDSEDSFRSPFYRSRRSYKLCSQYLRAYRIKSFFWKFQEFWPFFHYLKSIPHPPFMIFLENTDRWENQSDLAINQKYRTKVSSEPVIDGMDMKFSFIFISQLKIENEPHHSKCQACSDS